MIVKLPEDSSLRKRWLKRLTYSLLAVIVPLWALPILIAKGPFLVWSIRAFGPPIHGKLTIGTASLGWFSSVVLRDIELCDEEGRPLLQVAEVESDRMLISLLRNRNDLGTIRLRKPQVDVRLLGSQSNLEQVFAEELVPNREVTTTETRRRNLPNLRLELIEGNLHIGDEATHQNWSLLGLQGSFQLFSDQSRKIQTQLEGIVQDGKQAGSVKMEGWVQNLGEPQFQSEVKGKFSGFPLAAVSAVLKRAQPNTDLAGYLEGQCQLSASLQKGKWQVQFVGEIAGSRISALTPGLEERLNLEQLKFPCRLRIHDDILFIDQAELQCDVGKASLRGQLPCGSDWRRLVDLPGSELLLDVDLARLANKLPRTLHLHEGMKINSGHLHLECTSHARSDGTTWTGRLNVSDIEGTRSERSVAWREPINIVFQVRDLMGSVPIIDQLQCTSRFLRIDGSMNSDAFTLQLDGNLQQLTDPLAEIIDLGAMRLAGQAQGRLVVRRIERERYQLEGDANLRHFRLAGWTDHAWEEETIGLHLVGQGKQSRHDLGLESTKLILQLGSDHLQAELVEPTADSTRDAWGTWQVQGHGDLARWTKRALAFVPLEKHRATGSVRLDARVVSNRELIECPTLSLRIADLDYNSPFLQMRESSLEIQTELKLIPGPGTVFLGSTVLRCPTLSLETKQAQFDLRQGTAHVLCNCRGDLERLRHWFHPAPSATEEPCYGALTGSVQADLQKERWNLAFDLALTAVTVGPPAQPHWREPYIKLVGRSEFRPEQNELEVLQLQGENQFLAWHAKGKITHLTSTQDLDLTGQLTYNLSKIEPLLRANLGRDLKLAGQGSREFQLRGPLVADAKLHLAELHGEAATSWQSLKIFGCDVGKAEVRTCMQKGWLQVYPIETTINGGRLRFQPNLRLEPGPAELVLLPGTLIEKARLTSEMCAGSLSMIAPAFAQAGEAEGLVSITLEGGRLPLAALQAGDVKGTLIVHSAKVTPSPVVQELSVLLKSTGQPQLSKEMRVPFHMTNGRVYHENLEISIGDVTIRTSGSVGFDHTLALIAEIPIPARFLTEHKLPAALANHTIRLPIGGTVDHPRIDSSSLRTLSAQTLRDVAGDSLRQEVESRLQKLLRPRN